MEDEFPQYQGKPTVYLDQNILGLFVEGDYHDFAEKLKSNLQIVYSDETLKEIKRSENHSDKFLSVLKDLDAYHLKLILEQPEFKETGKASITKRDPVEAFQEYCNSCSEYDDIQEAMEQWLFKFSGGRAGEGLAEIHNEQKAAFSRLMRGLKSQLQELSKEVPDIELLFDEYEKEMSSKIAGALDETERLLKENIANDKCWSGIKDFRAATGLGPKELNNIDTPGVLTKIWEKYKALPPFNSMNIGIEEFFGLKQNPICPDGPYFKYQKVNTIYNMLNTLGYWPDSKVHKERRFISALSDNSHASMASFCNVLISRDKAFVKKVRATYEYLEIPTLVQLVVLKNA